MKVLQPPTWPRPRGYANGVTTRGRMVVIAGQALLDSVAVLAEAGAAPKHIVRMTWYVTDKRAYVAAYREIGAAFREIIGSFNAAMTAVEVSAPIGDRAWVGIEATAIIPD